MAKSIRAYTKSNRPDQAGTMVGVRLQPDQLAQLDTWIGEQPEPQPTRPEALRRLVRERLQQNSGQVER